MLEPPTVYIVFFFFPLAGLLLVLSSRAPLKTKKLASLLITPLMFFLAVLAISEALRISCGTLGAHPRLPALIVLSLISLTLACLNAFKVGEHKANRQVPRKSYYVILALGFALTFSAAAGASLLQGHSVFSCSPADAISQDNL